MGNHKTKQSQRRSRRKKHTQAEHKHQTSQPRSKDRTWTRQAGHRIPTLSQANQGKHKRHAITKRDFARQNSSSVEAIPERNGTTSATNATHNLNGTMRNGTNQFQARTRTKAKQHDTKQRKHSNKNLSNANQGHASYTQQRHEATETNYTDAAITKPRNAN